MCHQSVEGRLKIHDGRDILIDPRAQKGATIAT